jgi:hypothetical protein
MREFFAKLLSVFVPKNEFFTGLLEDVRDALEKEKDYLHEERALETPVNPFGNSRITESSYYYENQFQTSECVPHAVGLALAIERKNDTGHYTRLAPSFTYRLRSNYPQPGAIPVNIFNLYSKYGSPLYTSLPTPTTEEEANKLALPPQLFTEAEIFKGKEFYTLKTPNDINTIAAIAQAGHGVQITIFGTIREWATEWPTVIYPEITINEPVPVRHAVCALPYSGFMKDGKRYVTIQDSSWFGGLKLRHLSEDFIRMRCYGAGYFDTVRLLGQGERPKYTFTKLLKVGSTGKEVVMLQHLLISEGLLPVECVTGLWAGRTLAAVKAFQMKYAKDILVPAGLDAPTGIWGAFSIAKANELCK